MSWRNATASNVLNAEINTRWPRRDKSSDGTIGDAAHASRKSDHNPWVIDRKGVGVVRARDIDEDLDGNKANTGPDAQALLDHLLALARAGDPRLNGGGYLIYERVIYSEKNGWKGAPYHGINAHDHHLHVSLSLNAAGYDSSAPWGIWPVRVSSPVWTAPPFPGTIRKGSDAGRTAVWRMVLGDLGYRGFKVGLYPWSMTLGAATRRFQRRHGLKPDGVVGPKTWAVAMLLLKKLKAKA